jgi:hypothetical protein
MRQLRVTIPDGVEFVDLCLSRDIGDGQVHFKMAPIEAICKASALDLDEIVQEPWPFVGLLIAAWYEAHLARWRRTRPGAGEPPGGDRAGDGAWWRLHVPAGARMKRGTAPGRCASWLDQRAGTPGLARSWRVNSRNPGRSTAASGWLFRLVRLRRKFGELQRGVAPVAFGFDSPERIDRRFPKIFESRPVHDPLAPENCPQQRHVLLPASASPPPGLASISMTGA